MTLYQGAVISVVLVMGLGYPALRAQAPTQTAAANRTAINVAGKSWKSQVAMTATPPDTPKQAVRQQRMTGEGRYPRVPRPVGNNLCHQSQALDRQDDGRPMAQVREESHDPSSNAMV